MKRIVLLTVVSVLFYISPIFSQKSSTIKVDYSFKNIEKEKEYDHMSVTKIFVDGQLTTTSEQKPQSISGTVTFTIPKGIHELKVVNYAFYDGNWEEHTIANDYSIDCVYQVTQDFKKKNYKITIVFDIDNGTYGELK